MTKGQVTTARVRAALAENGYSDLGNFNATFSHYLENSTKTEVHDFFFKNEDTGEPEQGTVYVWMRADRLIADW